MSQHQDPPAALTIHPLPGIPEVVAGDDLGVLLLAALHRAGLRLADGDVLAVSSKIISKAQGLREPATDRAAAVLRHSHRVVAERSTPGGITRIVEALAGPVMAGAGIDASNTGAPDSLLILPADPDRAAEQVYAELVAAHSPEPLARVGIVVTDTAGRPWRAGQTDFALGAHRVAVIEDLRGATDADGRELAVTARAVADEIAAAADLVKGKAGAIPAALLRGLPPGTVTDPATNSDPAAASDSDASTDPGADGARSLVRTGPTDWFALGSVEAVRAALGAPPGSVLADQVGIPSVTPEEDAERIQRAIRLALVGQPTADVHRDERGALVVSATSAYAAGRVCARLEVALAGEGLPDLPVEWDQIAQD